MKHLLATEKVCTLSICFLCKQTVVKISTRRQRQRQRRTTNTFHSNITLLLITTTRPRADSPWGERKAILILKDSDGICHSNEQYNTPRVYLSYKSIGTHSSTLALLQVSVRVARGIGLTYAAFSLVNLTCHLNALTVCHQPPRGVQTTDSDS